MEDPETQDEMAVQAEREIAAAMVRSRHLAFCKECDRHFDTRSGCEADIRFDERVRARRELLVLLDAHAGSQVSANRLRFWIDAALPEEPA